jgi:hypothetical protein
MSTFCYNAPPQSVRFAHKYDPVPSMMMWGANYNHKVENAIILWDAYDPSCASYTADCAISSSALKSTVTDYKLLGLKGTNPDLVKDWVCTKSGSTPLTFASKCDQGITSYMSLLNPFPCSWVQARTYIDTFTKFELADGSLDMLDAKNSAADCMGGDWEEKGCLVGYKWLTGSPDDSTIEYNGIQYDFLDFAQKFFNAFEDFDTCVSDWLSTMYTHIAPGTADYPDSMGLIFTFTWVHSAYPMYPLCIEIDTSGEIESYIPAAMKTAIVAEIEAEAPKPPSCSGTNTEATCYNFCALDGYKFSDKCYEDCLFNGCKPIPVKEINDKYSSLSSTVMETYAGSGWADLEVDKEWMIDSDLYIYPTAAPTRPSLDDDSRGRGEGE